MFEMWITFGFCLFFLMCEVINMWRNQLLYNYSTRWKFERKSAMDMVVAKSRSYGLCGLYSTTRFINCQNAKLN
eukprot:UN01108